MDIKLINTEELISIIKHHPFKWIEARIITDVFIFTHFFYYNTRILLNEGIDGERVKSSFSEILRFYKNNYWTIDYIS